MITLLKGERTLALCFLQDAGHFRPENVRMVADRILVPTWGESFDSNMIANLFHLEPRRLLNVYLIEVNNRPLPDFTLCYFRDTPFGIEKSSQRESVNAQTSADFNTSRCQVPCSEVIDGFTWLMIAFNPPKTDCVIRVRASFDGNFTLNSIASGTPRPTIEYMREYLEGLSEGERESFLKAMAPHIRPWRPEAADELEAPTTVRKAE